MPDEPDLESVWAHAIDGLADSAVSPQHRAFLRLTRPLGLVEDTALLAAPNEFVRARTISTPMRSHGVPSMSTFMACVAPPTTSGCAIRRFASSTAARQ